VLDKDLPMAVDHLSDMLLRTVFRANDFEAERHVILEEINVHEDTPDDLVHDLFTETLWPAHPLGRPILGTRESIAAATPDAVRRFWKTHYVPGGMVVVAAGNVDHDALLADLGRHMSAGPVKAEGPSARRLREAQVPPAPSGRALVRRRKTEQAHICVGTNGLSRHDPDRFAFGVVNNAIGGGMSSRLFQEIREKRGLAYSAYSYHSMYAEAGQFAAYAGTTPARAQQVVDLMRREITDVAEHGLRPEEFERAKGHMKGALVLSLDDPGGRMSRLGKSELSQGEILTVSQTLRRIDAVTLEDARRVAERVLSQPMSLTVLGPFAKGAVT
jgi:predicted Zn-dependent peptidase